VQQIKPHEVTSDMSTALRPLLAVATAAIVLLSVASACCAFAPHGAARSRQPPTNCVNRVRMTASSSSPSSVNPFVKHPGSKGKILVLGGSGFLGGSVARRAALEGYAVESFTLWACSLISPPALPHLTASRPARAPGPMTSPLMMLLLVRRLSTPSTRSSFTPEKVGQAPPDR